MKQIESNVQKFYIADSNNQTPRTILSIRLDDAATKVIRNYLKQNHTVFIHSYEPRLNRVIFLSRQNGTFLAKLVKYNSKFID